MCCLNEPEDYDSENYCPEGERTSVQNAYRHWKDHGREFPALQNSKQYVEAARNFTRFSSPGTLTKIRPNGDIVFYDPSSNTFAITNQQGFVAQFSSATGTS
jgi:pyocin large subunit-like protein